jgi:hypothetical protein
MNNSLRAKRVWLVYRNDGSGRIKTIYERNPAQIFPGWEVPSGYALLDTRVTEREFKMLRRLKVTRRGLQPV